MYNGVFYYTSQKTQLILCSLQRKQIGPAVCYFLFPKLFDFTTRYRTPMIVLLPSGSMYPFQNVPSSRFISPSQIQSRSFTWQGFEIPSHPRFQLPCPPHSSANNSWIVNHYPGSFAPVEWEMSPTLGHQLGASLWKPWNLCDGKHCYWRRSLGGEPLVVTVQL